MDKLTAEQITVLCIQFCEGRSLLNAEMNLSTIEYLRHSRKEAKAKIKRLVAAYGDTEDKKNLVELGL